MIKKDASIPKISIIMPVHNTPVEYLSECLESVLQQSFKEYELIVVDDGSNAENTLDFLEKYISADEQGMTKLIKFPVPVGAALARNEGLVHANGEYVIFLDSDDIFMPEMLESMYKKLENTDTELCICGYREFLVENQEKVLKRRSVYAQEIQSLKTDEAFLYIAGMNPWSKLCRRDFLEKNHILFQSLSSCNDVYFSMMTLLLAEKVETITEREMVLYRTQTKHQISANRDVYNLYLAVEKVITELKERKLINKTNLSQILALLVKNGVGELKLCRNVSSKKMFYEKVQALLLRSKIDFKDPHIHNLVEHWLAEGFDTNCLYLSGNFYEQIKRGISEQDKLILQKSSILLWGYGKRGRAFEKWAFEQGIVAVRIYDQNMCGSKSVSEYGYKVVTEPLSTEEVGYVIASNKKIYTEACRQDLWNSRRIFNLEQVCPL